jgi:hypothetical protein
MLILIALAIVAIILIPLVSLAALLAWIGKVLDLDSSPMRLPQRPKPAPH